MSTAPSNEIATRTPAMQLVARIREPDFKQQVAMALPPTVTVDRFIRIASTALLANPDIAKLDHNSVLRAMVQSAAAGLIPDGKEAAIVGRGGQAVFQPMIGGFVKIAAEHGWTLKTKAVYANDDFSYTEEPEEIRHTPVRPGADRGDLSGAYAIATHKDGRRLIRFMGEADIAKRRAQATTQNVWNKWPAEMFEKTAGRDLFADLPLADSDLERERIKRLLSEGELLTDPTTSLYGSQDRPALSAGGVPVNDERPAASAVGPTEHTGASSQQAGDAVGESPTPSPAASLASGTDPQDEPDIDSPGGFNTPDGVAEDEAVIAAQHASQFVPPNGKYGPQQKNLSLAEIAAADGSEGWFRWVLRQHDLPSDYREAVWAFCRVYEPELWQQVRAEKEAQTQQ